MELRNLGRSDLRASLLGLGCNNFGWTIDESQSKKIVDRALGLGVNFFDTSDVYGSRFGESEEILGASLGARRKDAVIVTKFGWLPGYAGRDTSYAHVVKAVESSLQRLKTDYIDVYMIHSMDDVTPIEETLRALGDLVKSGKVRHTACSNLPTAEVVKGLRVAQEAGYPSFVASESEYSLLVREAEDDLIPALQAGGVGLLPFFPLASGMLTGKVRRGVVPSDSRLGANALGVGDRFLTDANFDRVEKLEAVAKAHGRTLLEFAFGWLAAQPVVSSIIAGATKIEQLEQNAQALARKLSADELAAVETATA